MGLSRVEVSVAYPMLSIGYAINAVAAWYLFGEALTLTRIAGIGIIIVGGLYRGAQLAQACDYRQFFCPFTAVKTGLGGIREIGPLTRRTRWQPIFCRSPAPRSTRKPSPASPRCCARAGSRRDRRSGAFEAELSHYCGGRPVRSFNSGTAALEVGLRLAGIGAGDEVITTPLSWVATANVILELGATPVFVDVDPVTRNIDLERIEPAITPKTKAILPVYLAGLRWISTACTQSR
jgi:hypothetical protein